MDLDSTLMGKCLGTPRSVGMGSDTGAAKRQMENVHMPCILQKHSDVSSPLCLVIQPNQSK